MGKEFLNISDDFKQKKWLNIYIGIYIYMNISDADVNFNCRAYITLIQKYAFNLSPLMEMPVNDFD